MSASKIDVFWFQLGSKRSQGAQLAKRGTTQAEIKSVIGYTLHNMVTAAKRRGHRVLESCGRFWLVHASDVATRFRDPGRSPGGVDVRYRL
jgi:hypothetical protein